MAVSICAFLGLGRNGHIGFNEPGAAFEKETLRRFNRKHH